MRASRTEPADLGHTTGGEVPPGWEPGMEVPPPAPPPVVEDGTATVAAVAEALEGDLGRLTKAQLLARLAEIRALVAPAPEGEG